MRKKSKWHSHRKGRKEKDIIKTNKGKNGRKNMINGEGKRKDMERK